MAQSLFFEVLKNALSRFLSVWLKILVSLSQFFFFWLENIKGQEISEAILIGFNFPKNFDIIKCPYFFFWFDPFWRLEQKLRNKFRWRFGIIEVKQNCFWYFLTFTGPLQYSLIILLVIWYCCRISPVNHRSWYKRIRIPRKSGGFFNKNGWNKKSHNQKFFFGINVISIRGIHFVLILDIVEV